MDKQAELPRHNPVPDTARTEEGTGAEQVVPGQQEEVQRMPVGHRHFRAAVAAQQEEPGSQAAVPAQVHAVHPIAALPFLAAAVPDLADHVQHPWAAHQYDPQAVEVSAREVVAGSWTDRNQAVVGCFRAVF